MRVRNRGDLTPWGQIDPEILSNLPPQAPRKPKVAKDLMSARTPPTPRIIIEDSSNFNFETYNSFNLLGEEEAI